MLDEDEMVDYAGSDADDVISLGGLSQADPLDELPEPEPQSAAAASAMPSPPSKLAQTSSAQTTSGDARAELKAKESNDAAPSPRNVNTRAAPAPEATATARAEDRYGPTSNTSAQRNATSRPPLPGQTPNFDRDTQSNLPPGWVTKKSKSQGDTYYYNTETKQSVWDIPTVSQTKPAAANDLPSRPKAEKLTRGDSYRPGDPSPRAPRPRHQKDDHPPLEAPSELPTRRERPRDRERDHPLQQAPSSSSRRSPPAAALPPAPVPDEYRLPSSLGPFFPSSLDCRRRNWSAVVCATACLLAAPPFCCSIHCRSLWPTRVPGRAL